MNRWAALALLLVVLAAMALRAPRLSIRPFHNDEAVNAFKVTELWQKGEYAYDPDEYHGPTLHYATLPILRLSGAHDASELGDAVLRVAPVLFGIGLILLLPLFAGGMSRSDLAWAALFIAVSPAMVFYSRYFIHEMPLVFFTALTLGAGWRYAQKPSASWAALAGAGAGLMFATKETFVITLAAMGVGLIGTALTFHMKDHSEGLVALTARRGRRALPHIGAAMVAGLVVWILFFSSFFSHWTGLADSFQTYLPWLKRAGGHSPHIHPWYFYLQRLGWFHPAKGPAWSEGLILALAGVGAVVSLAKKKSPLHVFLTIYTFALLAAYSVISYKTPWCLLSFLHGMILLAGIGASALVESTRGAARVAVIGAIGALTAQLAWQAWRASFVFAADPRNPYVYAQTVPDVVNLAERLAGIARVSPEANKTTIKVIAPESDYWPLPWYLRRFEQVGWYDKIPQDPFAPIIIVGASLDAKLDEKSEKKWIMTGMTELRPGIFLEVYVELELWKRYVASRPREAQQDQ